MCVSLYVRAHTHARSHVCVCLIFVLKTSAKETAESKPLLIFSGSHGLMREDSFKNAFFI